MKKSLTVLCSGAPNFFIYGVSKYNETYSLIDNQYWIRASNDLTPSDLNSMIAVETPRLYSVQE